MLKCKEEGSEGSQRAVRASPRGELQWVGEPAANLSGDGDLCQPDRRAEGS